MRSKRHPATPANANSAPFPSMGRHSADSTRQALAQAFFRRSVKMLERVSSSASSEALKSALSCPTDVGGVATLLSDLAPLGVDLSAVDPFVEAMARGAAIKQELLASARGVSRPVRCRAPWALRGKQWTSAASGTLSWRYRTDPASTYIRLASSLRTG